MLYGLTAPNWSNYLRKPKGRRRRPIPTDRARYGAADRAGGRQDRANHRPGRELLSYSDAAPRLDSAGTIVADSFSVPRRIVISSRRSICSAVSIRWRSSIPAIGLPPNATTISPGRSPAFAAGLSGSTAVTVTPPRAARP